MRPLIGFGKLEINISKSIITFKYREKTVNLQPIMYCMSIENPLIIDIGQLVPSYQKYLQVDLFQSQQLPKDFLKIEFLEVFFSYALHSKLKTPRFTPPPTIVSGILSLDNALCGYQDFVIRHALQENGIKQIDFV